MAHRERFSRRRRPETDRTKRTTYSRCTLLPTQVGVTFVHWPCELRLRQRLVNRSSPHWKINVGSAFSTRAKWYEESCLWCTNWDCSHIFCFVGKRSFALVLA